MGNADSRTSDSLSIAVVNHVRCSKKSAIRIPHSALSSRFPFVASFELWND
jgi:hypothetical protein